MENKKKTVCTVCLVLICALLVFLMLQMGYIGQRACLFFDANGLPTAACVISGVVFGILLMVLGRNINEKKSAMRTLCKVIGIMEIVSSLLMLAMTLLIRYGI